MAGLAERALLALALLWMLLVAARLRTEPALDAAEAGQGEAAELREAA